MPEEPPKNATANTVYQGLALPKGEAADGARNVFTHAGKGSQAALIPWDASTLGYSDG
jgi:hypothetical protein